MILTMTMSSNVTDVWQCDHDVTLILTLYPQIRKQKEKKEKENTNKKIESTLCISNKLTFRKT